MRNRMDTALSAAPGGSIRSRARLPDRLRSRGIAAVVFAICLAGAGTAGYLIGNSPEADVDAVRSEAAAAGWQAGSERGAEQGHAQGFREARERTYAPRYRVAYKEAYAQEFRSRGLKQPEQIRVVRR
jgi:hypothetical protein